MAAENLTSVRELDARVSDGIQVRLLWSPDDGRVLVSVTNIRSAHAFSLEVGEDESPGDVFHHPFAYAAHHGVRTDEGDESQLAPVA